MKLLERNRAIDLRKQGKTFREILERISVPKGSLSYWLRSMPLTGKQLLRVKYKNDKIKRKFIKFNKLRKMKSHVNKVAIFTNASKEISGFSEKELKFIGIALYWAEGSKGHSCSGVEFTNSDPAMIALMMKWFRKVCGVGKGRFRVRLQIHNPADIETATKFWSKITGVPESQFTKAYQKTSPTSKKMMGRLEHGICSIRVSDIKLITKIRGWLHGLMALSSSPA